MRASHSVAAGSTSWASGERIVARNNHLPLLRAQKPLIKCLAMSTKVTTVVTSRVKTSNRLVVTTARKTTTSTTGTVPTTEFYLWN